MLRILSEKEMTWKYEKADRQFILHKNLYSATTHKAPRILSILKSLLVHLFTITAYL